MPTGTYRWSVRATDAAGNPQSSTGGKRLVVNRDAAGAPRRRAGGVAVALSPRAEGNVLYQYGLVVDPVP